MKTTFIYNCEIINSQLLVMVGENKNSVLKWIKKHGSKDLKDIVKIKSNVEFLEKILKLNCVSCFVKNELSYYVLCLNDFKNNWESFDILNHEVRHYCQAQFKDREIIEEKEFEAYFQESVFRELRRMLNKRIKEVR